MELDRACNDCVKFQKNYSKKKEQGIPIVCCDFCGRLFCLECLIDNNEYTKICYHCYRDPYISGDPPL